MLQKSADDSGAGTGAVSVPKAPGSIKIAAPGENVDLPPAPLRTFEIFDAKNDEAATAPAPSGARGGQPKCQASKLKMALGGKTAPQSTLGQTAPESAQAGISKNLAAKNLLDETNFAPPRPLLPSEGNYSIAPLEFFRIFDFSEKILRFKKI